MAARESTRKPRIFLKAVVDYSTVDDAAVDDSSVDDAAIDDPAVNNVTEGGRLTDEGLLWLSVEDGARCGGRPSGDKAGGADSVGGSTEGRSSRVEALGEVL